MSIYIISYRRCLREFRGSIESNGTHMVVSRHVFSSHGGTRIVETRNSVPSRCRARKRSGFIFVRVVERIS